MKILYFATLLLLMASCSKTDFLDKKPSTVITSPTTLTDFQLLLDNTETVGFTTALPQIGSDDYFVSFDDYKITTATERNSYIWAKDIYQGDVGVKDWNDLYKQILYANTVLDGLEKSEDKLTPQALYLKGWALFIRAYINYDLTRTFCKSYDESTANSDLGIPLKLSGAIDHIVQRSSLKETYLQIFSDLDLALSLLPLERPSQNLNRPSKPAAYALLARIYLDRRDYTKAEEFADKSLSEYDKLIDFNTIDSTARSPFSNTNDEILYGSITVVAYSYMTSTTQYDPARIAPELYSLYDSNDLRQNIYFASYGDGTFNKKRMYLIANYPFTGLATDEVYLIKAECLARRNASNEAMDVLNKLLINRYNNMVRYVPLVATSSKDAISKVLTERRKELIWRGLRWHDLKRLNKEGANITLSRVLNGTVYSLPPNDPRWVYPIPDDEIALSGIQQNIR